MQCVFVIDSDKKPCMPVHPIRAKELLDKGKASVWQYSPFTIILKKTLDNIINEPIRIKIDPGSQTTGICLTHNNEVIFAMNLTHKGELIKSDLLKRRGFRSTRRSRKLRYREPRFNNRIHNKRDGWIQPSFKSRIYNIFNWVDKFRKVCNITDCSLENVKFDIQKLENPDISGIEYQQGTLYKTNLRDYITEKYKRKCAYCGKEDTRFELDHVIPKSKGGGNRPCNFVLACHRCNQKKGNLSLEDFVKANRSLLTSNFSIEKFKSKLSVNNYSDAAAVNTVRKVLPDLLQKMFSNKIELSYGSFTKYNRLQNNYIKDHWVDAACIGETGTSIKIDKTQMVLEVKADGRGNRRVCNNDKYGFPSSAPKKKTGNQGVQTGDIIKLFNKKEQKSYIGRCIISKGKPYIKVNDKTKWGSFKILQKTNGYTCTHRKVEDTTLEVVNDTEQ